MPTRGPARDPAGRQGGAETGSRPGTLLPVERAPSRGGGRRAWNNNLSHYTQAYLHKRTGFWVHGAEHAAQCPPRREPDLARLCEALRRVFFPQLVLTFTCWLCRFSVCAT